MDFDFAEIFNRIPADEQENVLHAMNCILDAFTPPSL